MIRHWHELCIVIRGWPSPSRLFRRRHKVRGFPGFPVFLQPAAAFASREAVRQKMNRKNRLPKTHENHNFQWFIAGIAAWAVGWSFYDLLSYSAFDLMTLAMAAALAFHLRRYDAEFAKNGLPISLQTIFAFWGTISIGAAAGILLAFVGSAALPSAAGKGKNVDLPAVFTRVAAAAAAAFAFSLSLGFSHKIFTPLTYYGLTIYTPVLASAILMTAASFAAISLLRHLAGEQQSASPEKSASESYRHGAALLCVSLLHIAFSHFGIEFGLVVVPAAFAADLAYKIHIRLLGQKMREIYESNRIYLSTVEVLSSAIDAREEIGMGHVSRTRIYAVELGKLMGIGADELNALKIGALLHDIGKLGVPDHILNKPGRLTSAELEKTKIHTTVGASILEKVGFPYPVVPTVEFHHEAWNGSGYPTGLAGEEIPITARILSVADAYDTLRAARPYRPPVSREHAIEFLLNAAGTRFDPKIVRVFVDNLEQMEAEIRAEGLGYDVSWVDPDCRDVRLGDSVAPNFIEQIKSANREVLSLYSLAREFSGSLNLEETMSLFTRKVAEFVPFDTCIVYLLDGTSESAAAAHVVGRHSEILSKNRIEVGEGATGFVLKNWTAVENVDPSLDFAFSDDAAGANFTTMASLPLISDRKLIGAVSLYSEELSMYQDEHLRLLETVLRIAADAIANALHHAEAESHAMTDPMTGLPNARHLHMQFEKEVTRASRGGTTFQMLVLDLDEFKAVNDTYGHKAGDNMLRGIANVIRQQMREYDFLARYGGDEFVAIIPETDDENFRGLCKRIEGAVSGFMLHIGANAAARVGISLGAATYPVHGETFDQLIESADKAMYSRKAVNRRRSIRTLNSESRVFSQGDLPKPPDVADNEIVTSVAVN